MSPSSPSPPLTPLPPPSTQPSSPMPPLIQYDKDLSYLVYRHYNTPRLPHLILEFTGHGVPWIVLPLLLFLFYPPLTPPQAALLLNYLCISLLDLAVIGILKPLIARKRPAYNAGIAAVTIRAVDQYSFPSGHATRAGLVVALTWLVWRGHSEEVPWLNLLGVLLITVWGITVAASRVALGRHHIIDVIVGLFLGVFYVIFWSYIWISDDTSVKVRKFLTFSHASLRIAAGVQSNL